jgi:hypothetical protein
MAYGEPICACSGSTSVSRIAASIFFKAYLSTSAHE